MSLMIECLIGSKTQEEVLNLLKIAGAVPVVGMVPVPMKSGTVIITVEVADESIIANIRSLPEVVEIFGDSKIGPYSG